MTYVPIIPIVPFIPPKGGKQQGKPPWLKLEKDEVFVRSYGTPAAEQPKRHLVMVAIGLLVFALLGLNFAFMANRGGQAVASQSASPIPWIALGVLVILVANVAVVVALAASRKRRQAAAYLTSKMLIITRGKDYAGVRLADITDIRQGSGTEQNTLIVHARKEQQPVARLPVADPAAAVVELAAYSKAAGAKLG